MNASARFHSTFFKSFLIILILWMAGCGSPGSSQAEQGDLLAGGDPHRLLGFVFDPGGQPVAFAEVGGEDYTSWDGVSTGNFLDYQGSWIPVHALGYASSFARARAEELGIPFFNSTLTPYQDVVSLSAGEEAVLGGTRDGIVWLAAVSPGQFNSADGMVGLAVLDPHDLEPRSVLFADAPQLRLRSALALEAFSSDLSYQSLAAGEMIELVLSLPSPLSESAAFARFDPQSGSWQKVDLGCTTGEENQYTCQLDFLDPLIGLFDLPETFAAAGTAGSGAVLASPSSDAGQDFDDAYNALMDYLLDQQEAGGGGGGGGGGDGGSDQPDPIRDQLVEDVADSAKNYARDNRTEGAKSKLGRAAQSAMENGQNGLADQLVKEMGKIAEELGKKALKESDCGEYKKLLKAAEQIMRTSVNDALAQQLIEKAGEMTVDCDVWDGSITVWMRAASNHPAGLPMKGSGGLWTETHKVKMWTNVDDYVMHGESEISLSFPNVSYVKEKPCKQEIIMSGGGGSITALFEGKFNGLEFQVNTMEPPSSGGSIQQTWRFQKKEDDSCVQFMTKNFSFNPYYSILFHGLSSDSPPLNYQEIFDSAAGYATDKGIPRFGGDQYFDNPDPELGIYPYEKISVSWYFFHTEHKLPIEEQ